MQSIRILILSIFIFTPTASYSYTAHHGHHGHHGHHDHNGHNGHHGNQALYDYHGNHGHHVDECVDETPDCQGPSMPIGPIHHGQVYTTGPAIPGPSPVSTSQEPGVICVHCASTTPQIVNIVNNHHHGDVNNVLNINNNVATHNEANHYEPAVSNLPYLPGHRWNNYTNRREK